MKIPVATEMHFTQDMLDPFNMELAPYDDQIKVISPFPEFRGIEIEKDRVICPNKLNEDLVFAQPTLEEVMSAIDATDQIKFFRFAWEISRSNQSLIGSILEKFYEVEDLKGIHDLSVYFLALKFNQDQDCEHI